MVSVRQRTKLTLVFWRDADTAVARGAAFMEKPKHPRAFRAKNPPESAPMLEKRKFRFAPALAKIA
jgi:hypothetical protein